MKHFGSLDLTEEEIYELLSQNSTTTQEFDFPIELFQEDPKPAAVLIPFLRRGNSWHILYTRRTDTLPEHSGQVAFPGGRTDPEDISPEATALREAYEEIRLEPDDVKILGRMHSIATITNYFVTPIIGVIPWPYNFVLRKEEVSKVFMIPLEWLSDPRNHSIQERLLPKPYPPIPVVYFERYEGELLWGVSARITLNLLDTLKILS